MAKGKKRQRRWWQRWWLLLLIFPAILLGLVGTVVFFLVFASVPLPEDIGDATTTVVLDREGRPYGQLSAEIGRVSVDIEDLPDHVPLAVLGAEDRRFFEHPGVSATSVLRAAVANLRAGETAQGGSTITQQYVKNAVTGADRTLVRKLKEAALALKLEQRFDKDEILELYLNTIYWGRGAYGVEAAAQTYFGIPATQLTLGQAATLAGIISSPENLDPAEEPDAALRRQRYTLDGMLEQGWIGQDTWNQAVAAGLPAVTTASISTGDGGYYLDAVQREVAAIVGDEAVFRGLTVTTEVDPRVQAAAQDALATGVSGQPFTGAVVLVDPDDGGVRALVGGPDPVSQPFNTAIRSRRQPGSSFKAVALAAWVANGWSPESRFAGGTSREVPDGQGGTTTVTNYSQGDKGPQTLRQATWSSTNTAYLDAQEELGVDKVAAMGRLLGIPEDRDLPEVATLSLGVASLSPLDMASAYATFASGGVHTTPRVVSRIVAADGEVLFEAMPEREAVLDANVAYVVSDVLAGVVEGGTGRRADLGRPAAGKTGTTDDFRDAWFVGYTPHLAGAVWVGNLDNSPMDGITGGSIPAEIWAAVMTAAHEGVDATDFPEPDLRSLEVRGEPEPEPTETATETASDAPSDEPSEGPSDPGPGPDGRPPCPPGVAGQLAGCATEDATPPPDDESDPPDEPSEDPSGDPEPQPSPEPSGTSSEALVPS